MAKQWTEEERKAFGEKMKAARAKKEQQEAPKTEEQHPVEPVPEPQNHTSEDPSIVELTKMVLELKQKLAEKEEQPSLTEAILALTGQNTQNTGQIANGKVVGTTDKYDTSLKSYENPVERLKKEPRLRRVAFNDNYELEWETSTTRYDTRDGIWYKEPKFTLKLNQIVLDDQGEPTNKRIGKARMVFHEDPDTAVEVAERNGLPVNLEDQVAFLNEMRYMRMKEWLFECFWPNPVDTSKGNMKEIVVGGQVVTTWEVSTEEGKEKAKIQFDKLDSKL